VHDLFGRLNRALGDRYDVERELDETGTVYLAEGPHSHREVAPKVLTPELAAVPGASYAHPRGVVHRDTPDQV
jgi:hypothetical protein